MGDPNRELRKIVAGVLACFFLSGATGLVYEVLWVRMLGLLFGHTVFAVTTVLTAFMAGLGLGSFLLGRVADRRQRPLALYALLEAGIGVSCLLVPLLLPSVEALYLALSRSLQLSSFVFSLAQFVLVFSLLLVPTTLMGATLPVLSRFFVSDEGSLGKRVGQLYALNTFGAVVGTALAGYFLLPAFGARGTLYLAATLNIGIGALMLAYDRHLRRLRPMGLREAAASLEQVSLPIATPPGAVSGLIGLTVTGLALSGAASMIYEVAWTRALTLVIGSSTYAFTAMLLAFLLGVALGSALFAQLCGERRVDPVAFALVELGIGLSALLTLPAFEKIPDLLLRAFTVSLSPEFVLVVQLVLSIAAMIVPTLLVGASFPCAVKIVARGVDRVGSDVGRLYALNTLGAIAGTVLAGFALIPAIGAHAAVKAAALLNLVVGGAIVIGSARSLSGWQWGGSAALTAATLAGVLWIPPWNQTVMASGVSVYASAYRGFAGKVELARAFPQHQLLFYEDGLSATVSVHRQGEHMFLRVNGKTDASTGGDMHTQLMSGHLPLLLHPDPKTVLVIGLGSGVTVGAVAQHPVERIDAVEIEPAVVRASRLFARENRGALSDPRVRLVLGDGRNFLLATPRNYDVIISEPSNPWIGGLAALFSQEFYELARRRLNPEGIMLQWVQGYGLLPSDLKMVVKTFRTAFPATSIWHTRRMSDYLLLGRERPRPLDLGRIEAAHEAIAGLRQDMERSGFRSPAALLADFVLTEPDVARYAEDANLNTDDLLPLEFSAPRSLHLDTAALNFRIMLGFRTSEFPLLPPDALRRLDTPGVRHDLGIAYVRKGLPAEAAAQFEKALALDPAHTPSLLELGKVQLTSNLPLKAVESFEAALRRDPRSAEAYFQLALAYQAQQLHAKALGFASKAVALKPREATYRAQLAQLLQEAGRYAEAVEHYLAARRERPTDTGILDGLGAAYLKQRRIQEAVTVLEEALRYEPDNAALLHRMGSAYLAANRHANAVGVLRRAVAHAPLAARAHIDLGYAHLGQGDLVSAIEALERGLWLDPVETAAARTLSEIYAKVYGPAPNAR
ncbi:MAG: fused MFS/spermidine synthase [Candidatus Rokubacteria bacterium]|nr:fused MFS/spermidine synthase [Candidatus Rokubacteria bacterium]